MENNDFVHTLDAVYNLCSEIKERIASVEMTDEEESNKGIILLSDNLQRLQTEITGMKSQLSVGRHEWEKFCELTLVRAKEMHNLYANLCATNTDIFSEQERIVNELRRVRSSLYQQSYFGLQSLTAILVADCHVWDNSVSFGRQWLSI